MLVFISTLFVLLVMFLFQRNKERANKSLNKKLSVNGSWRFTALWERVKNIIKLCSMKKIVTKVRKGK